MNVEIENHGKEISFKTDAGQCLRFQSVWLRFSCNCKQCIHENSRMLLQDPADVNIDPILERAEIDNTGKILKLNWTDHEGYIPLSVLQKYQYTKNDKFSWLRKNHTFPVMSYNDLIKGEEYVWKYTRSINDYGATLLTDVPNEDGMVKEVAAKIAPVHNTIWGTSFVVEDKPNANDTAYTAGPLAFHMDTQHYEAPAGIQLLHCIRFDDVVVGGETTFLDAFHVAEQFRRDHPEEFKILSTTPATFQKILYNRKSPVDMAWRSPHIVLNEEEKIVYINWSPHYTGPLIAPPEKVIPYYRAYSMFAKALKESPDIVAIRLRPGDLIAFNNRQIVHGRRAYTANGGGRKLEGCYISFDEFVNRLRVLCAKNGDTKPLTCIGYQM